MKRYTLAIHIAGYAPPENRDLMYVNSKAKALDCIANTQRNAERYGAGYAPLDAWLWHGQLDDVTDLYPDYVIEHGPRGGRRWTLA